MKQDATPVALVSPSALEEELQRRGPLWAAAAHLARFEATAGQLALVPGPDGALEGALAAAPEAADRAWAVRGLPTRLPAGDYRLEGWPNDLSMDLATLAWTEGLYRFDRYKTKADPIPRPTLWETASPRSEALARACALARDLINTPASDMGPAELEEAARAMAEQGGAEIAVSRGEALLEDGYPSVHAVGRAADPSRAPRIVEITWGEPDHPLVALVGKGVTFDTGGLDLKPSAGMRLMKKDMGGAAHVLGLASAVMRARLPVRLVVLTPLVENAVSGAAMRPGDVLNTRQGLTIEVGNTDAEGRLILADALARAAELEPVLTLDLATLTGAARIAVGPEVVPYYTADDVLAADIDAAARLWGDPVWRMPLWTGYAAGLESDVADIKNDPDAWVQAGSIAAALFLKRFAPASGWAHFDIFGWNPRSRPGRPVGAEAQAIRALFGLLETRFAHG